MPLLPLLAILFLLSVFRFFPHLKKSASIFIPQTCFSKSLQLLRLKSFSRNLVSLNSKSKKSDFMWTTISFKISDFWRVSSHSQFQFLRTTPIFLSMEKVSTSFQPCREQNIPEELQLPSGPQPTDASRSLNLRFDKMLPSDHECNCRHNKDFGCFTLREAMLDEEYWTAAWLRAESHWEDQLDDRYIDSHKRKFAEQVKKEESNGKRTVLNSVVGTLDTNIRYLLHGETFPGEQVMSTFTGFSRPKPHRYGYISNLCVAKSARRHGIASKMLHLSIEVAKSAGVEQVFVHVHKDNTPALQLYEKIGFQMVNTSIAHSSEYLLCIRTS